LSINNVLQNRKLFWNVLNISLKYLTKDLSVRNCSPRFGSASRQWNGLLARRTFYSEIFRFIKICVCFTELWIEII